MTYSWDAFVLPSSMHGMWPRIGREDPGVGCKVRAHVCSEGLLIIGDFNFHMDDTADRYAV